MYDLLILIIADWLVFAVVLAAVVVLVLFVPGDKRVYVYSRVLIGGLISYFAAKVLAVLYQPADMRPFEIMGVDPLASYLPNPGFPSDHTVFVWAIMFAVWYSIKSWKFRLVFMALAISVSFGRVIALVHTPIDVFGGILAAMIGSLVYLPWSQMFTKK